MTDNAEKILEQLKNKQYSPKDKKDYASIYLKFNSVSRKKISTKIKSQVLNAFRSKDEFSHFSHLPNYLIKRIDAFVALQDEIPSGIACFASFESEAFDKKHSDAIELYCTRLPGLKMQRTFIGKIYDLIPLVLALNYQKQAIAIQIAIEEAKIFLVRHNAIQTILRVKNPYIPEYERNYLERYSPKRDQGTVFSTGKDKIDRAHNQANKSFVNLLCDEIKTNKINNQKKVEYVCIFYSEPFTEFTMIIKNMFQQYHTELIAKNLIHEQDIQTQVQKQLTAYHIKTRKKEASQLKIRDHTFVSHYKKIITATQQHKIDQLFIQTNNDPIDGYVGPMGLVYEQKQKDSIRIKNIKPWIGLNVLQSGGTIKAIPKTQEMKLAAILRY